MEITKKLDELGNVGSLMARGQFTQPRSIGPWVADVAKESSEIIAKLRSERDKLGDACLTTVQERDCLQATISRLTEERDGLRKALEEAKERFANLVSGRCPAPPGTANDPVAFRDWAEGYALIGFNSVSIALATPALPDAEQGRGAS